MRLDSKTGYKEKKEQRMYHFIFDLDDTVYDQLKPFKQAFDKNFPNKTNFSVNKLYLLSRKFSDDVFNDTENGKLTLGKMHRYRIMKAFEALQQPITEQQADQFQADYAAYQKQIVLTEDIKNTLNLCKENEILLGMVTNGPAVHQREKIDQLGLKEWISEETIFISSEVKLAKPDKRLFEHVQQTMRIDPSDTYYIGDSYNNDVVGAKKADWKAIWNNPRHNSQPITSIKPDYIIQGNQKLLPLVKQLIG